MNTPPRLPRPAQTLAIMQTILDQALDAATCAEGHIADLEADYRDASSDWVEHRVTVKLSRARIDQTEQIMRAAEALKTIATLRAQHGMEPYVLTRVFAIYSDAN